MLAVATREVGDGRRARAASRTSERNIVLDLNGMTILLTGGTGSFGNAFVERVTRCWPDATVRVYSRDELKQSQMRDRFGDRQVRYLIGDVRDRARMTRAVEGADIVVHAAAMKQVPGVRVQPVRGGAHQRARRAARRRRGDRRPRPAGDRAVDRQGRQPGEPLRRHQAVRREDLRAGQRLRSAAAHAPRVRTLRQRGRARAARSYRCSASSSRATAGSRSPTSA